MNENKSTFVKLAVNRPLWKSFIYKIDEIVGDEVIGSRVSVNFAGSTTVGIITELSSEHKFDKSKIKTAKLLDRTGILSKDILSMLKIASSYYHYPFGQCCATALPKILRDGKNFEYEEIPGIEITELGKSCNKNELRSNYQKEILNLLDKSACKRSQLREQGIPYSAETALIKKGLIKKINLNFKNTNWLNCLPDVISETPPCPNSEQEYAINTISNCNGFKTFVLNGITGSGKTEVYLRVIENILKKGKAVLVLVPEISLTPQTFHRFYKRFKVPVSSMHSALSNRERLDAYLDMVNQRSAILIGTRTALFTPIPNLGLIVLDEEHDQSFKQNDGFRYHARSLANIRAKICNCPVILGSATPSLETIANLQKGLYNRIDLKIRAGGAKPPTIEVINLLNEPLSDGIATGISKSLEDKIGEETAKGNQVLLFLNRRGYARNLICHNCGHIFMCPCCDNPMTVHRNEQKLRCHICEYTIPIPKICPKCRTSNSLIENGFGTEQVAVFLKLRYPDLNIERIDRDEVKSRDDLEEHLKRVRSGESKILIGTQMLAKGHDFPDVTLAGILDLDSSLFSDDFRSKEEAAQLFVQVSGRSGRAKKAGTVYIQTRYPEHDLIKLLVTPNINYIDIANYLLAERASKGLPPYTYMAFLLSNSTNRNQAHVFLIKLKEHLDEKLKNFPDISLSPVLSDKMEKRQNRFHFHILVTSTSRNQLANFLNLTQDAVSQSTLKGNVRFAVEVDPQTMY